jgi:hypothetical protein
MFFSKIKIIWGIMDPLLEVLNIQNSGITEQEICGRYTRYTKFTKRLSREKNTAELMVFVGAIEYGRSVKA